MSFGVLFEIKLYLKIEFIDRWALFSINDFASYMIT